MQPPPRSSSRAPILRPASRAKPSSAPAYPPPVSQERTSDGTNPTVLHAPLERQRTLADRQQFRTLRLGSPAEPSVVSGARWSGPLPGVPAMTNKSKPISDPARALLTAAAMRVDYLVWPPKLPIAAARQVLRSLLIGGLVEEVPAPIEDANFAW